MGKKEHYINLIEDYIGQAYEENGEESLPWDTEIVMPLRVVDGILKFLNSQEVKEPLEDVVFFVGKPTLESIVYHVLCRKVTLEAMRKDPNIHFMLLKAFDGHMEEDGGNRTFDEQETRNRNELEWKTDGKA